MRLKLFLAISLLTTTASACCYDPYSPKDTHLYRIMEDIGPYVEYPFNDYRIYDMKGFDFRKENLKLWRQQTGTKMSDEHLEAIIYGNYASGSHNVFFDSEEAGYCLKVARNVQKIRNAMNDPWYFPSSRSSDYMQALEELVETCHNRAEGVFRGRYVLQGLRCLNTLRRWDDSIEFWEQQRDSLTHNVIFTMAEREVAAAYHQMGNDSIAADIYARVGDIASLRMCRKNRDDEMEYIYEHCPNSPYFPEEIQCLLTHFDRNYCPPNERDWYYYRTWDKGDSLRAEQFLKLCRRVVLERKAKDLAMWNYATAVTYDILEQPKESMKYIRQGERLCKDDFLRKSFRLLRMHVEAQILPMNHNYDQRLFRDLRWLCQQIDNNMSPAEKERLSKMACYKWDGNTYYWNDAMRRILHIDVCPRMIKAGRTTRALQLANFADYYLFRKLGNSTMVHEEWREDGFYWDVFSYSSDMFELADSLSANKLATYVRWQTEGQGEFDLFLASGSNQDVVFWHDIVGTHYIRENKYEEAQRWLSRLPKGYERETNIYREQKGYYLRDPFDLSVEDPNPRRKRLETTTDYKLNFAKGMIQYEHDMKYGRTTDIRGKAKVYYAAGIRNQWEYCWALTRYSHSCYDYMYWDKEWNIIDVDEYRDMKNHTKRLTQEGLDEITDCELKARLLHAMQRNKEVMDKCPNTEVAQQLRLHCDTWRDYVRK